MRLAPGRGHTWQEVQRARCYPRTMSGPWLADTHVIALITGHTPATIRSWAHRHTDLMPRRGTGKYKRALYDVEEHQRACETRRVRFEADTTAIAYMLGVQPHTIRNWAARGHLHPIRTEGTRTIYDAEAAFRAAKAFGYLPEPHATPDQQDDPEPCSKPFCTRPALDWTDMPLALCSKHAIAVWLRVTGELNGTMLARPPRPVPDTQPVVYFIRSGELIKIGTSENLPSRYSTFATSGPEQPEILLVIAGDHTQERQVHALFAADRVRGEWFRPSDALMAFIDDLQDQDIRHVHGRFARP